MTGRTTLAVVGGGITGLAAGWEAARLGAAATVFEASQRIGGKVASAHLETLGRAVETGPDAFLARVPWAVEVCEELGLADELVSPDATGAFVYANGDLRPLPSAQVLGVPADPDELASTGLVSAEAVETVRAERDARHPPLDGDCAVGELVRSRLGDEVCDHLVEPLIGGINAGLADRLSVRAAAPQLAELASGGGSMVATAARLVERRQPDNPVFLTHPEGLGQVAGRLARSVDVRLGAPVYAVDWTGSNWTVDGEPFDAVVVATPAPVTARLLGGAVPDVALLGEIGYASVALVLLVVDRRSLGHDMDGTGFVVARDAGLPITACSWGSQKWGHWGGGRHAVLRVSLGHDGDRHRWSLDGETLVAQARAGVGEAMGTTVVPVEHHVARWPDSFPQYRPGHLELVAAVHAAVAEAPGNLAVAGAALEGLGIPACIRQGREAAHRCLE